MSCTLQSGRRADALGAVPCEIIIVINLTNIIIVNIIIVIIIIIVNIIINIIIITVNFVGRYAVYFVVLLLCGDWTLLNVFLAIACDSLDQVGDESVVTN